MFFVDLDPAENNMEVHNTKILRNKMVQTELPRANKNNIIQCMKFQQYGHTKSCCNNPFICVSCGGSHNSKECKKVKEHQQNAHYGEAIFLPITKSAKIIIT